MVFYKLTCYSSTLFKTPYILCTFFCKILPTMNILDLIFYRTLFLQFPPMTSAWFSCLRKGVHKIIFCFCICQIDLVILCLDACEHIESLCIYFKELFLLWDHTTGFPSCPCNPQGNHTPLHFITTCNKSFLC